MVHIEIRAVVKYWYIPTLVFILFKFTDVFCCFDIVSVTDFPWESSAIASNFTRKCDALAVSGFVDYGDEIDIIAPADILKQIFKMPYSKARLSIAVHRIGDTLVLNTGYFSYCWLYPDVVPHFLYLMLLLIYAVYNYPSAPI